MKAPSRFRATPLSGGRELLPYQKKRECDLKKTRLWRGLSGLFAALTIVAVFADAILFRYAHIINATFQIQTSVIEKTSAAAADTEYYKSDFGAITADNLKKLEKAAEEQTAAEAREGAVLLKNGMVDGRPALPLDTSAEKNISLIGRAVYSPLYRTAAACTRVTDNNPERVVDLKQAMQAVGFSVNTALIDAYENGKGTSKLGFSYQFEEPLSFYEECAGTLDGYRDAAVVMLQRSAGEGTDMSVDQAWNVTSNAKNRSFKAASEVSNSLALQTNEKAMLEWVKAQGFGKIIVLINSPYAMELGWLDEYGVDACLYIGTTGLTGFTGIADLLAGKDGANPSGRLVDTFAANSLSSPAIVNAAGNTPQWANLNDASYNPDGIVTDYAQTTTRVSVQQESIYVGYKYYETRYADAVMGDAGAKSAVGASFGDGWDYAKEICYPFGCGLSYTTFRETIQSVRNNGDHTYAVTVRVENTGAAAGKHSVQLYASTPYGAYERERKIEKPAVLLVGFDKTRTLAPGETQDLTIQVDEYLFASYDYTDTKGYVLTAGDYFFAVGESCHAALNNILGAQGYTGLTDENGAAFAPDGQAVYRWTMGLDTETFRYGEGGKERGVAVTNLFDRMDINSWDGNDIAYLTRSDWAGTFPTEPARACLLGAEMETLLQGDFYQKAADAPSTDAFAQGKANGWKGVDNGLSFVAMRHAAYDDDALWNRFIDQFTLDDLVLMTGNYFGNKAINTQPINIPAKSGGDGCQGVGDEPYSADLTGGQVLWPCLYTSLLSCTFNPELIEARGSLMANQALFLNQTVIWTGGGNLHRTPFGGRQAEYFSEDANLVYLMSVIEMTEMEKHGILAGIKHFAANDQESYREGLNTFYNEQAFREGALRGFEGAVRKGRVHAIMQAFNRQGVVFSSACYELNVKVLRDEWGFEGEVITDASSGTTNGYKSHYTTTMANGTDIYCLDGDAVGGTIIANYIKESDDGAMLGYLRQAARHTAYALSRSSAVNGLSDDTVIRTVMPAWQVLSLALAGALAALTVLFLALLAVSVLRASKGAKGGRA